ncbi:MAG: signal peptidase I [Epsilonproteobacteria bacterium]|nr:signal peptidase I [Campylobacterota bacterium]
MNKTIQKIVKFLNSWTGTIIIVLLLIFFVAQSFVIPSGSMKRTLLIGDFLFAKKFAYGIPIPEIPWLGWKVFPDFNHNGHLIEGPRPKRADIVIFYVPTNRKDHFVKRCVAVGGDEIIYYNKHLLIHFHEGDEYIKKNYPPKKIVKVFGKLWVDNPYMDKFPGIQYLPENRYNSFELMLYSFPSVDMKPILAQGLKDAPVYSLRGIPVNAFYKKVPNDCYYMIGDNRDDSDDSRFWGCVPYSLIIGKPWLIYFSMEFRSYDRVMYGKGGGKDHHLLKKICKGVPLESKECRNRWERYRFSPRWERVGRLIEKFQYEVPTR